MRRLLLIWFLLLAGIVCVSQSEAFWQSRDSNYNQNVVSGGGGGCSAATTFIARTSGLTGTESSAYTAMICGMITDGVGCSAWSGSSGNLDALYIFATNTTTTANLNLCSTSFGLTIINNGSGLIFTADVGFTGSGDGGDYLYTGFVPSTAGGNLTLNSMQLGAYDRTSRSSGSNQAIMGATNVAQTAFEYLASYDGGNARYANNDGIPNVSNANAQGSYLSTRTASNAVALYRNGSSIATNTTASIATMDVPLYLFGYNAANPAPAAGSANNSTSDQLSAAWFGGGASSTQAGQIQSRINGYMTALGINVY